MEMIILPVGVLSFVRGWDLGWEGFGFGIVWCLLKRPSIALLLDNHIALKKQPMQPTAQTILQTNGHMSSNNCLCHGGRVVFKKAVHSLLPSFSWFELHL